MSDPEPVVYVVDDERELCESLAMMLEAEGLHCRAFTSAEEFLANFAEDQPGVLLIDVKLDARGERMSGLDLHKQLNGRKTLMPILFMTGHGDVPMAVRSLKAGAYDFLEKPVNTELLLSSVRNALKHDADTRQQISEFRELDARFRRLTEREREVLDAIASGGSSKAIGQQLNIAERTVEAHRRHLMQKLGAHNAPELVQLRMRYSELAQRLNRGPAS